MTDPIRPSRLVVTAAVPDAEFSKKFIPAITNPPPLPAIPWGLIGATAPTPLDTPLAPPRADAVVITWAEAEWAALVQVFCSSDRPMPYSERSQGGWPDWGRYSDNAPAGLDYWGDFRVVQIGAARVLLFKSNAHYAANQGEQNLQALIELLIQEVRPALILSVGTAGGARDTDPVGTVNVVRVDALYENSQPQSQWPTYASDWSPDDTLLRTPELAKLLLPIPTSGEALTSIAQQFNQFYATDYPLSALDPNRLNLGAVSPQLNDLTAAGTPLVTARSFVVANTSGNLARFACVEMDDAIIARTAAGAVAFGSVRNISDPIQNAALPDRVQGAWGEAIYTAYGFYTSFNGALAAWALLAAQFAAPGGAPSAPLPPLATLALDRAALSKRRARAGLQADVRGDAEAHRLRGRARVLAATGGGAPNVVRLPITNVYCGSDYTAALAIGANGVVANVILDTGSSTVAVEPSLYSGAGDGDLKTTTELQLVEYGTGGWAGPVVDTTLSFRSADGETVALPNCPIAIIAAQEAGNLQGVGGILGLAYNGLNEAWDVAADLAKLGKTSTYPWPFTTDWTSFAGGSNFQDFVKKAAAKQVYPTPYFDEVEEAGIVANTFAFYTLRSFVSFRRGQTAAAASQDPLNNGYFILGGGDAETDLFEGAFASVKVVADRYYNTNLKSVRVGGGAPHAAAPLQQEWRQDAVSNSIIDSGTSDLSLAQDVYDAVLEGLEQQNPAFIKAIQAAGRSRAGVSAASLNLATWPNISFTLEGEDLPDGTAGPDVELVCAPDTYWQTDFPAAGRAVFQISGPLQAQGQDTPNQSILGLPVLNNYFTVFDRSLDINGVIRFATIKPLAGTQESASLSAQFGGEL